MKCNYFSVVFFVAVTILSSCGSKETLSEMRDAPAARPLLEMGISGAMVKELQEILHEVYAYDVTIDGYFSESTRDAVVAFQSERRMRSDGRVEKKTWRELLRYGLIGDENLPLSIKERRELNDLQKDFHRAKVNRHMKAMFELDVKANRIRSRFINKIIVLMDSKGAIGQGHSGLLLVNRGGQAFYFSYYPTKRSEQDIANDGNLSQIRIFGKLATRFKTLSADELLEFRSKSPTYVKEAYQIYSEPNGHSIDNKRFDERFDSAIILNDGNSMDKGALLYETAMNIALSPNLNWNILNKNCHHLVKQILAEAGIWYPNGLTPSNAFKKAAQSDIYDNWF